MAVVDKSKFLPQGGKGGSLAIRPKTNLVSIKQQSSSLAKIGGKQEDPMLIIKTKVIKIEDLLKGTLAAEKKAVDEKRKQQEEEGRDKQEDEVEKTPKSKEKGIKIPVPGKIKSFWGNIKKYIGTVLFGWLALKLLPLLPKLIPIVKFLATAVDFVLKWGGKLLDGLVTFVDWGYKAVDATQGWLGDKFGDGAAKGFESFMTNLNGVMNLVIALGFAAAKMSRRRRGGGPDLGKGKKSKWRKATERWWKKTKPGRLLRNNAAIRKKLIRNLQRGTKNIVKNTLKRVEPKNILKAVSESNITQKVTQRATYVLQKAKNINLTKAITENKSISSLVEKTKNIDLTKAITENKAISSLVEKTKNVDLGKTTKSITENKTVRNLIEKAQNVDVGKIATKGKDLVIEGGAKVLKSTAKNINGIFKGFGDGASWLFKKTGEGLSWTGKKIGEGFSSTTKFLKEIPANIKKQYDDIAAKIGPIISEKLGAAKSKFDEIGAGIGKQLDKLDPKKVMIQIQDSVKKNLDDILQKNPLIKKITTNLNPKNAIEFVAKNFDNVGKKMLPIADVVRKNKGMIDGLGPADIAIDAIFAILDYAAFGESPINAIVKAMAGTLGFAAGSAIGTAATAGVPSPLSFIGGIFGAAAGEWLASKMLSGVIKAFPGLAEMQDPIAEKLGLAPRSIIRDPSGLLDHMIRQDDGSVVMKDEFKESWNESQGDGNNIVSTNGVSQQVDGISASTDSTEVVNGQEAYNKGFTDGSTTGGSNDSTEQKVLPVVVAGGNGTDSVSEQMYASG